MDKSVALEFGRALGDSSSRSGPITAAAGRLGVASVIRKVAPPARPNFIARWVHMTYTWRPFVMLVVTDTCSCRKKQIQGCEMYPAEGTRSAATPPQWPPILRQCNCSNATWCIHGLSQTRAWLEPCIHLVCLDFGMDRKVSEVKSHSPACRQRDYDEEYDCVLACAYCLCV